MDSSIQLPQRQARICPSWLRISVHRNYTTIKPKPRRFSLSMSAVGVHFNASAVMCANTRLHNLWVSPSMNVSRSLYCYLQQWGISSSRKLLAGSTERTPVSFPLTSALALNTRGTGDLKTVYKPQKVRAVIKGIKQSPVKVNMVAALVRGIRVEDALLQLQVSVKRAAKAIYQAIHSARANALHNHGMDPDRLLVAELLVGKGFFKKRVTFLAKGRCGIRVKPECRLTVVLRELTPKEETKVARPHKLIETTSWERRPKSKSQASSAMTE